VIAAAYYWGWMLAHPAALFVWGGLAAACVIGVTAYYWATGKDIPQAPRRGRPRSRAGGTRARRHTIASLCRRARAAAARARRAIALRLHGITIDIPGPAPGPYEPPDLSWYCSWCGVRHHPGDICWGQEEDGEYIPEAHRPECTISDCPGCVDPQDWSAWGGQPPCCCERENPGNDATTSRMDCPRHGNRGYGPENFIPPTRKATDAELRDARLDYAPAPPFAECLSDDTIARGFKAVQ
jgi:hypothetical protein